VRAGACCLVADVLTPVAETSVLLFSPLAGTFLPVDVD
jgi:hypothetical protein